MDVERLSLTFLLEEPEDGTTDLYLAMHYDPDSPFSAILSPASALRQRERRLAALTMFRLLAEEAARHEVSAPRTRSRSPRHPRPPTRRFPPGNEKRGRSCAPALILAEGPG